MTPELVTEPTAVLLERLRAFVEAHLGTHEFEVADLRAVGMGRSRDNWVFDLLHQANGEPRREELILRCDPEGGLVDTDRAVEFEVLRRLESSELGSPAVRWLDEQGTWFGRPALIMQRLSGTCDYGVLNGDRPLLERQQLAGDFCDLLVRVHSVDWAELGLGHALEAPEPSSALHEVERWETILRKDQLEPLPALDLALRWFRVHAPATERIVLVHGDFKPGNILLEGNHLTALLDWELAHLGDPLEDLGWVTQPLRTAEHLIEGSWSREDLIARYEETSGTRIDRDALDWWTAFSSLKTAVMQVSGLRAFLEGRSDHPYRPTRRVLSTLLEATTAWR